MPTSTTSQFSTNIRKKSTKTTSLIRSSTPVLNSNTSLLNRHQTNCEKLKNQKNYLISFTAGPKEKAGKLRYLLSKVMEK